MIRTLASALTIASLTAATLFAIPSRADAGKRKVATPSISPTTGSYSGPLTVSISDSTGGATIHYTLDGSVPGPSSPVYSAPFTLTSSATVMAYATKAGSSDSSVAQDALTVSTTTTSSSSGSTSGGSTSTSTSSLQPLYSSTSPWNSPIAAGATVDPNSPSMVQGLVAAGNAAGFVIAVKKWSWPMYYADQTTPTTTVALTASWAPAKALAGVPIPSNALPSPDGDGHLSIVNTSTMCEYDFWQAVKNADGSWSASWGNTLPANGTGWYPGGYSATGSGDAGMGGVVRPEDFQAGVIPHAIQIAYAYTMAGGPVPPATESDGQNTSSYAIPEGAHLQLDPLLDLTTLGLNAYETIIAKAMQTYGMYVTDSSGSGVSFAAQNPQSTSVAYPWGDQTYVYLPVSLLSHMRVLTLPAQYHPPGLLSPGTCGTFQ